MFWTTILFGVLLVALGVAGFFATEKPFSPALIPSGLGVALLIAGLFSLKQSFRKNAMHAAVVLALLGLVGTAHSLIQFIELVLQQPALLIESVTAVLCGLFIWLAVRSFLEARRQPPAPPPLPEVPPETAETQPGPPAEKDRP